MEKMARACHTSFFFWPPSNPRGFGPFKPNGVLMHILHTESSNGWGGQEIRILKESIGLRQRGHTIVFAVVCGGKLVDQARKEGFTVYEVDFRRISAFSALRELIRIIRRHQIDTINTHSSLDAWLGGLAARLT